MITVPYDSIAEARKVLKRLMKYAGHSYLINHFTELKGSTITATIDKVNGTIVITSNYWDDDFLKQIASKQINRNGNAKAIEGLKYKLVDEAVDLERAKWLCVKWGSETQHSFYNRVRRNGEFVYDVMVEVTV